MTLLLASLVFAEPDAASFPEQTPGLIEACLANAVESQVVDSTEDSHKYICTGQSVQQLWKFLEDAKIESWDQDAGVEGHWLTRKISAGCVLQTNSDG